MLVPKAPEQPRLRQPAIQVDEQSRVIRGHGAVASVQQEPVNGPVVVLPPVGLGGVGPIIRCSSCWSPAAPGVSPPPCAPRRSGHHCPSAQVTGTPCRSWRCPHRYWPSPGPAESTPCPAAESAEWCGTFPTAGCIPGSTPVSRPNCLGAASRAGPSSRRCGPPPLFPAFLGRRSIPAESARCAPAQWICTALNSAPQGSYSRAPLFHGAGAHARGSEGAQLDPLLARDREVRRPEWEARYT